MSAIGKPQPITTQPAQPPVQGTPTPPAGGGMAKWLIGLVVVALIAGGVYYWQKQKAAQQQATAVVSVVRTAKAVQGELESTLRLTGQTASQMAINVIAPKLTGPESGRELIILMMVPSGSRVKKNQVIAQIDGQSLKDHVDDVNDQVQGADADIRKRKAEQAVDMENLLQTVRVSKANLDKARLERKGGETRTVIDQELLKLAEEEAEAQYQQRLKDIDQKKIVHAAELKILEFTRERHGRHRDRHAVDVEKFTIRAAMGLGSRSHHGSGVSECASI